MIRRAVFWLALLSALSATVGAAAVLPTSGSAPLQVVDHVADAPGPTTTRPSEPTVARSPTKIWVCVILVDRDGNWRLKPGKNPLHVSENAQDALDAKSPHHPSYVVDRDEVGCEVPPR